MTSNHSKKLKQLTRRRLLQGSVGLAGVGSVIVAATKAQANTQKPPAPASGRADANGRFQDKVVLITGATSGIGEGTAYAFAKEGAKVFFCGRHENLGKQVETKIKSFGGEATYMPADVRKEEDVKAFVDGCVQKYGRIDIAFNNAGIVNPNFVKIHEQKTEDFLDSINTNALGTFLSMKYEIPVMLKQGSGVIINTASRHIALSLNSRPTAQANTQLLRLPKWRRWSTPVIIFAYLKSHQVEWIHLCCVMHAQNEAFPLRKDRRVYQLDAQIPLRKWHALLCSLHPMKLPHFTVRL